MKTKTTLLLLLLFLFTSTIYSQSANDPDKLGGPVYVGTIPALTVPHTDARTMRSSTSRFKLETVSATNLEWPNSGAVHIEKTAQATSISDKWRINVMVEGKNIPNTTDVVLVIDDSGSMDSNSKMTTAKEAAKKFVTELLTNSTGIRVAIVTINDGNNSGVPQIDHSFTDDKTQLITSINTITAGGGTNLQGGFYAAGRLMDNSSASKKVVILLSDGEPTYSYKSTTSVNIPMNCDNKSNFSIARNVFERDNLTVSSSTYTNVVGNGSDFKFSLYSESITCDNKNHTIEAGNHGIPTAYEAGLLINSGVDVYTIGFGVSAGGAAEKTLQKSQSKGYFPANTINIQNIYSAIRSNISYAATNAILTDPMSTYIVLDANVAPSFSVLPSNSGDVVVSKGTVNFTQNGYVLNDPDIPSSGNSNFKKWKITWTIGTVSELGDNMYYFVTLAPNTNPTHLYDANEQTYMDYTDVNGNSTANQITPNNFTIPKVSGGKGSIEIIYYAVNTTGEPVNSSGTVVNKENALKLISGNSTYFEFNGDTALTLNQSYNINPGASYQSNNKSYQLFCSFGNTDITPTAVDPNKKVWFGYFVGTPPIANDQTECTDGTATQKLTATATAATGTIKWYLTETGGAVTNNPVQIGVGSTTYYAEVSNGNCITTKRTPVKLTITPAPIATITSSDGLELNCNITSTTLTASGGTNYLWSNGESTAAITVTTAEKFSVIVTNDNGCTATTCVTTTLDNAIPIAAITSSDGLELNCTNPSTTLTASGGTNYLWSNGETTAAITVTTAEKFSVIVTNDNGCSATTCVTTTLDNAVPIATIISSDGLELNCTNPSTTLTASGGTTYLWSNGETTAAITVTTAEKFSVIVTNDNGCSATTCVTTTLDNAVPIATITSSDGLELNCNITSTTLTASGGTNYLWSNGETTAAITVTTAEKFSVIVTNNNGCTATTCVTTTLDNAIPIAAITSNNGLDLNCTNPSTTLTASGGTSYLWSNGETTAAITVTTAEKFSVIVTNDNGCTATTCATTTLDNAIPIATITSSDGLELNCTNPSTTLTASGGTTYLWSNGETTQAITVTTAEKFSVLVTNDNGCTATTYVTTTLDNAVPIAVITSSDGLELNCTNPSTTLTASGGTNYLWSNGETTQAITVTTAEKFSVIVTNDNGCSATASVTTTLDIAVPIATIISSDGLELNCTNPSTTLTASGGISYLWSNGETTSSITVTTAEKFSVIVTNDNGCTATTCVTTTLDNAVPIATIISSNGLDLNCTNPSTTLTASGGTTYLWSNGETTSSITVTTAEKFSVIVTNDNGCTATTCVTTTLDNVVPIAVITSSDGLELNCTNPSTTLTASGGTNYLWSNGETTQAITVTTAEKFSVLVANDNDCTATTYVTTTLDNAVPIAAITSSDGLELNCNITSTTLTAGGGISYLWSNGETTSSITVTTAEKFSVIVTNDNGCSATASVTTTLDNVVPIAVITSSDGLELNCTNPSTTLTASGGTNYLWSNGETTQAITVTTAEKFSVIVTNNNGCTATTSITTTLDNVVPIATIISSNGLELNCDNPSTTLTASGGTNYLWSNGETTAAITVTTAEKFSVIVTNDNGCSATTFVTTTLDNVAPLISLSSKVDVTCFAGNDGAITINSSGNSSAYSYAWTKNNVAYSTSKDLIELSAGIYTVIATSTSGCSSNPFTVTVNQPISSLSATAVITNNINCIGCSNGAISLTISGGNDGIYRYLWSNNETTKDISNLTKGDYSVEIKDSKGCTVNYNYTISQSGISLTKEGTYVDSNNDGITNIGDVVAYTFVVKNTGNVTLTNLTIIDENAIVSNTTIDTLAAGATNSTTFTASHSITQRDIDAGIVYNLATVKGYDPDGNLITATSTDPTPCITCPLSTECTDCTTTDLNQNPSLKVIKTALTATFSKIGDILLYTIVVENTGNVTLHQIRVTDPLTGLDVTIAELLAGTKSEEYSQSYTVTQQDLIKKSVTNIATAEGLSPNNILIKGSDTVTINESKTIIDAVDDSKDSVDGINGIKNVINVLTNDILNQSPATLQNVTLSLVTADATGMLTLNPDGSVDVKQGTPAGTYTLTYQICETLNSSNCDTATVTVKVIQNEVIKITGEACNADTSVTDLANLLPYGTSTDGTWIDTDQSAALNGSLLSAFELEIRTYVFEYKIVEETGTKNYLISIQINDDCKVLPCGTVLVHNAFSPNGDGRNDYFAIDNIDETNCYSENNVEIYNRWGVLVFETKNYSNSSNYFDGTSRGRTTIKKGDGLPAGTYFYIVNFTSVDGIGATVTNKKDGYLYLSK